MARRKFRMRIFRRKRTAFVFISLLLVICLLALALIGTKATAPTTNNKTSTDSAAKVSSNTETGAPTFDKNRYSIDEPGSPWWIVNKQRPLPAGYVPADLAVPNVSLRLGAGAEQMKISSSVIPSIEQMFQAAATAGNPLVFASGYRSEAYQRQLYQGYIQRDGQAAADRYSARPGTSEHQTGLAFDVCAAGSSCDLTKAFGTTAAGLWVAAHAYEYGFIIHYQDGKESVTGYDYEPWHLRYVGPELAQELHAKNLTLEEFFNL